jgi:transposase
VTKEANAPWRDEELLRQKYIDERMSCPEIAEELGCSGRTVDKWRRRYGINPLYKRRDWLDEQYNEKDRYIVEIAEETRGSRRTVAEWLDKLGVRTAEDRPADYNDEKPWHDPERLRELYHGEELSAARVADEMGCSPQTVRHWLIEFGIERRSCNHRTIDTPDSIQRRYPTVSGGHSTVLIHRFLAYAVGKMSFDELCDPDIVVHHRSNVGWDNRPENLEVMSRSDHMSLHGRDDYEPETF